MEENAKMRMSRRRMLKFAGIGVGALVAACQPKVIVQTVEVEKVVEKQVVQTVEVAKVVEVQQEVTRVVEKAVEKEVTRVVEVEKAAEVTGTFWVLQKKDFFPEFNDWFRAEMVGWCKERGWALDISYMAGYTGGTPEIEKLLASVASGNPPDLVMHSLGIAELRQGYALEAVTPVVEQIEAQWGKAAARQYMDYRQDDQWWAVPYFQRSDGGWFLRSAFGKHDIDIHNIRLFTDMWEACLEVSEPENEIYGWGVTINRCGDGDWFRHRVKHGWGAYVQDESGQFVTFDSPEMVEAMTRMTEIYMDPKWENMMPPGVLAWTDMNNNEVFLAGKLAYTFNGGTIYGKGVLDENPLMPDVGFHAPPGGPVNQEFNSLSANNWMIMRGARNFEAAAETILHYMLPLDNQDAVFSAAPAFCLPAYEKLWAESNYIKTNPTAAELESVARDPSGVVPGTYPGPANNPPMASAGSAGIENDMVSDILRGTPVAEAVKTCHDRYVAIFKEFDMPGEK
jgi:multiple sugar transport system substrate-binding protein